MKISIREGLERIVDHVPLGVKSSISEISEIGIAFVPKKGQIYVAKDFRMRNPGEQSNVPGYIIATGLQLVVSYKLIGLVDLYKDLPFM